MLKICQMLKNALINSQKKWGDFVAFLMVSSICVTGAWISDHISVFAGRTGVGNFFVSVGNGFMVMCDGVGYFLNCAVSTLQGATGDFAARGISLYLFCCCRAFSGVSGGLEGHSEAKRKI